MTIPAIAITAASVTMLLEIPVASDVTAPPVGWRELKNIVSPTSNIAAIPAISPILFIIFTSVLYFGCFVFKSFY